MSKSGGSGGTEKRDQVLPNVPIEDTGFVLPEYDFAGNVPPPYMVGVRKGGSLGDVIGAASGIAYYSDVIAFGQSSSFLTSDKPFWKLGINFFMKTGMTCPNGAQMYSYFDGMPKGDSVGKSLQKTMAIMGLPGLNGIASGIIEDVQSAMDTKPILQAGFGNAYPACEKVSLPIGNAFGQTTDPQTGDVWVDTKKTPIDGYFPNGRPYQTRWIQKKDRKGNPMYISRKDYDDTPKTHNLDGTEKKLAKEGFDALEYKKVRALTGVVALLIVVAILYNKK